MNVFEYTLRTMYYARQKVRYEKDDLLVDRHKEAYHIKVLECYEQ